MSVTETTLAIMNSSNKKLSYIALIGVEAMKIS